VSLLHPKLDRQLRKVGAHQDTPPTVDQWHSFLERVNAAYMQEDNERYTVERAIAISSQEMLDLSSRLARERDRLDVTVASLADGLCVLSSKGLVEIANRAAEQMLGVESGGLLGQHFLVLVSGGGCQKPQNQGYLRQLDEAIAARESCRCEDARFTTVHGEPFPVSLSMTPIEAGPLGAGSVVVFTDIRKRKMAEDALRESESRFRAIFESAAVGMVRVGLDGRIDDCNGAFGAMLGEERSTILGSTVFDHLHPDEAENATRRFELMKQELGSGHQIESRYVNHDGSAVWTKSTISFVRNPEGAPAFGIGVVENVTAQRNLEISLRQAQKLESVGQLAAGIAHEINTPVQFVSDSVHFVRDAVTELFGILNLYRALRGSVPSSLDAMVGDIAEAEKAADLEYLAVQLPKALDRALDGVQRVATIVRGMKAFAHPDRKDKVPADLNSALESTITIAGNEYKYVADVETEFGELPLVTCHVGELNQVFLNVIVNAAHAIGDVVGGTETRGRIRITTRRDGDSAVVSIADTGGGIPEAVRHRVFDPFFTTKEVGRGTGQGLAIARSVVVEKHQGELTFETQMGQGTTFTIRLPIHPAPEAQAA
jgi:PAS domain S-box-containing protein